MYLKIRNTNLYQRDENLSEDYQVYGKNKELQIYDTIPSKI
jgi:hypothetical protein